MKILFVAPEMPWPTDSGSRQRTFALLRALAQRHEVTLSAPADQISVAARAGLDMLAGFLPVSTEAARRQRLPVEGARLSRFRSFGGDLFKNRLPYFFRLAVNRWQQTIDEHASSFDAFFCRYSYMASVLANVPADRVVVDADDVQYVGMWRSTQSGEHGWGTPLVGVESLRTYLCEQRLFRGVAQTLVCSRVDARRIRSKRTTIVANGVDIPTAEQLTSPPALDTLVFVGSAAYGPNKVGLSWFLRNVWPRLKAIRPAARFNIVGRGATLGALPDAERPDVTLVPDVADPIPWIAGAAVSVTPLLSGMGTRIKIAEALACGRPVVSTSIGAEGYDDVREEQGLILADRPEEMASTIADLLADNQRCRALGERARRLAAERFSWEKTTATLAEDMERWVPSPVATKPKLNDRRLNCTNAM